MPTRSLVRHVLALATLSCLSVTRLHAQVFYPNDATINYAVNDVVYVGYANITDFSHSTNKTSPTISLVTGGNISGGLGTYNNSTVNVSSGSIGGTVVANNTSHINVSGGSLGGTLSAEDSSVVNVFDGNFGNGLFAVDNSTVTISGGTFGQYLGVNFVDKTAGVFTLVGSNLMATNARADTNFGGTDYDLSGTLQGGTNLSGYVLNVANGSTFKLQAVPETSTLVALPVLLVTLGAGLIRKCRSRS